MATNYPINPRVRAYGKARLDMARRANAGESWKRIWKAPMHTYPFRLGGAWKQCVEYKVDDFAAEVGFYIDILGLEVNSLDEGYAQFTSPQADFYFAILGTPDGQSSTPPDAIRIQFMVEDIFATASELESRGIHFEMTPQPCQPGSALHIGAFLSPHGIPIEIWGRQLEKTASPYAENEADLLALISSEREPARAEASHPTSHKAQEIEDEEEEFFPGLGEEDEDEEAYLVVDSAQAEPAEDEDDDIEYVDEIDGA